MTTTTSHQHHVAVVSLDGALVAGVQVEPLLAEIRHLLEGGNRHLVVDLGAVWLVNSAGLHALALLDALYRAHAGRVVVSGLRAAPLPPHMRARLAERFALAGTLPEALALYGLPPASSPS